MRRVSQQNSKFDHSDTSGHNLNPTKAKKYEERQRLMESISPVFGRQLDQSEESEMSFILDKPILVASLNTSEVTSQEKSESKSKDDGSLKNYGKTDEAEAAKNEIYLSLSLPPDMFRQEEKNTPENDKKSKDLNIPSSKASQRKNSDVIARNNTPMAFATAFG